MKPGELVLTAPRAKKPPQHISDLDHDQRREVASSLGLPAFRADQMSRHWFGRLEDDPSTWTDIPVAAREALTAALLPALLAPVRAIDCDGGETIKTVWKLFD